MFAAVDSIMVLQYMFFCGPARYDFDLIRDQPRVGMGWMELAFRGRKADTHRNFSQLRLGDPKGLPSFLPIQTVVGQTNLQPAANSADSVRRSMGKPKAFMHIR